MNLKQKIKRISCCCQSPTEVWLKRDFYTFQKAWEFIPECFPKNTATHSPTLVQPPFLQDVPILISSLSSSGEIKQKKKRETKTWYPPFEEQLKMHPQLWWVVLFLSAVPQIPRCEWCRWGQIPSGYPLTSTVNMTFVSTLTKSG